MVIQGFGVAFGTEKQHVEYISSEYENICLLSPRRSRHMWREMFLSDGEFLNVNKLIFMNENLYFDIIMMIEQTLVDQTAQAVARVLKIELSDHWPTMTAISSQSIKPPTALCNLYCWQNDTYSQQTLQITDIAEWYFSSLGTYQLQPTPI